MYTTDDQNRIFNEIHTEYARMLENICMQYIGHDEEYRGMVNLSIETTIWMAVRKYHALVASETLEEWLVNTCAHRFAASVKKQKYADAPEYEAVESVEEWMEQDTAVHYAEQLLEAISTREPIDFSEYMTSECLAPYIERKRKGLAGRIKSMFGIAV